MASDRSIICVNSADTSLESSPILALCSRPNLDVLSDARSVILDLSECSFITASQMVALAIIGKHFRKIGGRTQITNPPSSVERYISRMNLYRHLGQSHPENFARHNSAGKFVPLMTVDNQDSANAATSSFVDVIASQLNLDRSVPDMMNYSLGEVLDNILQHSLSAFGGVVSAQYFPKLGYVEMCVADGGRGIATSMQGNPNYAGMTPEELTLSAFERGCGEFCGNTMFGSDRVGKGMGLAVTASLAKSTGGYLWCVSQHQAISIDSEGSSPLSGFYFPGTLISLRIPTNVDVVLTGLEMFGDEPDKPVRWSPSEALFYDNDDFPLW